jgi:hypothetical protein
MVGRALRLPYNNDYGVVELTVAAPLCLPRRSLSVKAGRGVASPATECHGYNAPLLAFRRA